MPAQLTTKQQVNGYRFLLRRLEHALMRHDVRMLHDPMRSHMRALVVGITFALLLTGGCAVYGLIKPAGSVGDSKIIAGKDSGGMYVMVGDTLHPVLNLASARLIIGSPDKPSSVAESKLSDYKRGPLVGIPGAPQSIQPPADADSSNWVVCDTVGGANGSDDGVTTTVLAAAPDNSGEIHDLGPTSGLLVSYEDKTYLLVSGKRHLVHADDDAVERAFGFDGVQPRPVSPGMLNAFAEGDTLATPQIDGRGKSSSTGLGPVGSIIRVPGVGDAATTLYVVLGNGVQKVEQAAADVIRYSDTAGGGEVKTVAPAQITSLTQREELPVNDFPKVAPSIVDSQKNPVGCLAWQKNGDKDSAKLSVLAGRELPLDSGKAPVAVATADGTGPGVDGVYVPPSTGAYVATTGTDPDSPRRESLVYVNDAGVRFGVADAAAAKSLGLGDTAQAAPWPIVGLLPSGPALSRHDALVERDSVTADAPGAALEVSETPGAPG